MQQDPNYQSATDDNEQAAANPGQGQAIPYPRNIGTTRPYCPYQNPYYRNLGTQSAPDAANVPNPGPQAANTSGSGFDTGDFIKGALIGAAVAYLMTNKNIQDKLFKTAAKTSTMFQTAMEEVKERYEDAKAEVDAENQAD